MKKYIIVHHSATVDGRTNEWDAIRRYHTSWRRLDLNIIVTQEEAGELMAKGVPVTAPWRDIGYHRGIERENGVLVVREGRPLTETGAHATGFNDSGVGLCIVGNYDRHEPDLLLYEETLRQIGVIAQEIGQDPVVMAKEKRILGHWETYRLRGLRPAKTCPGVLWDMDKMRQDIINTTDKPKE